MPSAKKAAATKARRPTADDFGPLFEKIGFEGMSGEAACAALGIHWPSANAAIHADQKLLDAYMAAREQQGDFYGHKVADLSERVIKGEIDPKAARVAMHGYQYTASRMNRKLWGERLDLNHSGGVTITHEEALRELE